MKKFDIFVESVLKTVNEGRIAHKNKTFKVNLNDAKRYIDGISDDSLIKVSYLKMLNSLDSDKVYTPESLKKALEISLLNDLSPKVAKSLSSEFVNYLSVRDVFEKSEESSEISPENYSMDIADQALQLLQIEPMSKNELIQDLQQKFPDKTEEDINNALASISDDIEEEDGLLKISTFKEKEYDESIPEKDSISEFPEEDDLDSDVSEEPEYKKALSSLSED